MPDASLQIGSVPHAHRTRELDPVKLSEALDYLERGLMLNEWDPFGAQHCGTHSGHSIVVHRWCMVTMGHRTLAGNRWPTRAFPMGPAAAHGRVHVYTDVYTHVKRNEAASMGF